MVARRRKAERGGGEGGGRVVGGGGVDCEEKELSCLFSVDVFLCWCLKLRLKEEEFNVEFGFWLDG